MLIHLGIGKKRSINLVQGGENYTFCVSNSLPPKKNLFSAVFSRDFGQGWRNSITVTGGHLLGSSAADRCRISACFRCLQLPFYASYQFHK